MKLTFLLLISLLVISCKPSSSDVPEAIEPAKEKIIEAIIEELEPTPQENKVVVQMYQSGRHEKSVGEGAIILSIHKVSDTSCRFVFDTRKTSSWAKIAGDLIVDQDGKATYSGNQCESLQFHFTKKGISVKEFKCDSYHGRKCAFDGFYTIPSKNDEKDPAVLLKQIEKGEIPFDFYAMFTEPFWTVYFIDNKVIFNHMEDGPDIYFSDQFFDSNKDSQRIRFSSGEKDWTLIIEKGEGSDGMSEVVYPYKVIMNETFHGGGGEEFCKENTHN